MEKYRKCSEKWRKEIEEVEDEESESENDNVGVGRTYGCNYCKRGFTNAQALGGHMNIHRKDKAKARQHHHPSNFSSSSSSSLISYKPTSAVMEIEMESLPVSAYSSSFVPQPQKNHHHHQLYYPFAQNNNNPCPRFISSHQPSIFEGNNNNNHHLLLHHHHDIPNTTTSRTRRLFGMHEEENSLGADLSLRISSSAIIDHPFQGDNNVRDHNNNNNNNNNKEHVDYINHGIDLELRLGYYP